VAKRLSKLREEVEKSTVNFNQYLTNNIEADALNFLYEVSKHTEGYIFSGLIRNFFLGNETIRDVDIVLASDIELEKLYPNYKFKRNSFGGYKIEINNTKIDIWILEDTWALQYQKSFDFNFDLDKYIPNTAFFNFSSIIFSLTENRFHFTTDFLRFLRDKKVDLVYLPNANYHLCVINTFYYTDTYYLGIGEKLRRFIIKFYKSNFEKYEEIQLKHFGKILYDTEEIKRRILKLRSII
jgi:hypothetical protein